MTTHPMVWPDDGLPVSAAKMRERVEEIIGDPDTCAQVLCELSYWAHRCAEVKLAGGDPEGSDKAQWMSTVLQPDDDEGATYESYEDDWVPPGPVSIVPNEGPYRGLW